MKNKIAIILIIVITLLNVVILSWKFFLSDSNIESEKETENIETSKIAQILENKESEYSINGTWLGWAFGGFAEFTITDSNEVIGRFVDDFSPNKYEIIDAKLINDNILMVNSITKDSTIREYNEDNEYYFFAVDENHVAMIKKPMEIIANASVITKKTSGEGIVGVWEYEDGNTIEFIKEDECNYGISGNCYKMKESSYSKMEDAYFDDYFSYFKVGKDFAIAGNVDKMYGGMMYNINNNKLYVYAACILLRK